MESRLPRRPGLAVGRKVLQPGVGLGRLTRAGLAGRASLFGGISLLASFCWDKGAGEGARATRRTTVAGGLLCLVRRRLPGWRRLRAAAACRRRPRLAPPDRLRRALLAELAFHPDA